MSELLFGKALNWTCWDDQQVLTAQLNKVLVAWAAGQAIKVRLDRVESLDEYGPALAKQPVGLAAWALWGDEALEPLCLSLATARDLPQPPLRVCYVAPELSECLAILCEAGAQIVISQLTSLEAALAKALPGVRLSNHGFHPLTGGLWERLPWSEVDDL